MWRDERRRIWLRDQEGEENEEEGGKARSQGKLIKHDRYLIDVLSLSRLFHSRGCTRI